ncbi:MAG: EVE domain-containing protein [Bdellovibrionaceae bacterium]|nr:EVE domain-containing protein [Bdellovibrio sp.]
MAQKFWLMKSEPDTYSIDHLKKDQTTWWEGVRNYQARNYMVKDMQVGDGVLFYHSNAQPPGVAGLAFVSHLAVADNSQFDKKSSVYDPKATKEKPNWFCTQVQFKAKFKNLISLNQIKVDERLKEMIVIKKGSRLSIQPVQKSDFDLICGLDETEKKKKG